jgi:hypothetical protein
MVFRTGIIGQLQVVLLLYMEVIHQCIVTIYGNITIAAQFVMQWSDRAPFQAPRLIWQVAIVCAGKCNHWLFFDVSKPSPDMPILKKRARLKNFGGHLRLKVSNSSCLIHDHNVNIHDRDAGSLLQSRTMHHCPWNCHSFKNRSCAKETTTLEQEPTCDRGYDFWEIGCVDGAQKGADGPLCGED